MEKRLWAVVMTAYAMAEDHDEAIYTVLREFSCDTLESCTAEAVEDLHEIPECWRTAFPFGEAYDRTCAEILAWQALGDDRVDEVDPRQMTMDEALG
jgi:hypothetical protein